jgi:hypothetical protein
MDEWAMSSSAPMARNTYDGSSDADVHALPDDSAMDLSAISRLSPSTYANERLTQPGYRLGVSPLRNTIGSWEDVRLEVGAGLGDLRGDFADQSLGQRPNVLRVILQAQT